jgi:hypothetical protein
VDSQEQLYMQCNVLVKSTAVVDQSFQMTEFGFILSLMTFKNSISSYIFVPAMLQENLVG